jgi:arabinoxylan arabinofuranohydrolase
MGSIIFYFPADDQIGVAVSDSPTGPFKDALEKPLIGRMEAGADVRSIDPNIFIDDDGQAYLYFANSHDHVAVVKLKQDMITRDGPIQVLDLKNYHEGIWVHKRNGLYYFSYPSYRGDMVANLMEYSVTMSPLGPFQYKGVILDNHSRNIHGSITEFKGRWWLFYHVAGPSPYERRVCVAPLHYDKDGNILPVPESDLCRNPRPRKRTASSERLSATPMCASIPRAIRDLSLIGINSALAVEKRLAKADCVSAIHKRPKGKIKELR